MGKSPSLKPVKVEKSTSSKEAADREALDRSQQPENLVWALDDEESVKVEDDDIDVTISTDERLYEDSVDDRVYDNKLKRTFIVKTISAVDIKKILGTDRSEAVLNVYIVDPMGVLRTIVVWGDQAYLVEKWFRYGIVVYWLSNKDVNLQFLYCL